MIKYKYPKKRKIAEDGIPLSPTSSELDLLKRSQAFTKNLQPLDIPDPLEFMSEDQKYSVGIMPNMPTRDLSTDYLTKKSQAPIARSPELEPNEKKKPHNWVNDAVLGLTALDAFIPDKRIDNNTDITPEETDSQYKYGTGSQAAYDDGGELKHGGDLSLSIKKAKKILKDGKVYGKSITDKQKKYFGWIAGGHKKGSKWGEDGLEMVDNSQDRTIDVQNGGLKPLSYDTYEIKGPSHEQGGVDLQFAGNQAEVEGDETVYIDDKGDANIMGNLRIPPYSEDPFYMTDEVYDLHEDEISKLIKRGYKIKYV